MTGTDYSLPPATSRRELRERERAAAGDALAPGLPVTPAALPQPAAPVQAFPAPFPAASLPTSLPASGVVPEPTMLAVDLPPVPRRVPRRTIGSRILSVTALLFAGAFIVGVTVPANALDVFTASESSDTSTLSAAVEVPGQVVEVDGTAAATVDARDGFEVKSWAEVLKSQYGSRDYSYRMSGWTGAVRWPFPYVVPISSGFGDRAAPCRGCSTTHNAIDLTPGAGAPIYAIADGVVIRREPRGGSWGNNLTIEHRIGGHVVTSSYAHMQWDSSPIELGQTVKVGDFLGLVGATGQATGAHLHLEIKVDGVYVDPYVWLKAHAG